MFKRLIIGVSLFWLTLFIFFPNLLVLIVSFLSRDNESLVTAHPTFENYLNILDPIYLKVLISSCSLAFITTLLTLIIAFPFALILSRLPIKLRNLSLLLIIIPFWTSALVRTYCIKIILTTNGLLNQLLMKLSIISEPLDLLYTNGAVVMGLVYTLLPFMILPLYAAMEKLDIRFIEAARDLGAGYFNTLLRVIIPLSAPGIIAGALLVFLPALGLFYIPDILGGSKTLMLGNLIKNQFLDARNWPFGSALSVVLTIIMGLLLALNYKTVRTAAKKGII
ncbi:MAG: spermidine/putrescine ABC transporter permease PotB [Deferribacteraceae bacterium]|nr:spermidine/putrescine ABC transporter permease PotB [Deferribacteraceae bacterium]